MGRPVSETSVRAAIWGQHGPVGKSKSSGVIMMHCVRGCGGDEQGLVQCSTVVKSVGSGNKVLNPGRTHTVLG